MRNLRVFAAAIAATLAAGSAAAQTSTPAPAPVAVRPPAPAILKPESRKLSSLQVATARPSGAVAQYDRALYFARCATHVAPAVSARLLAAEPDSPQFRSVSRQLRGVARGCVTAGSYVSAGFLRGAIAEMLYRREAPPVGAGGRPDPVAPLAAPASYKSVALCLFAQSPVAVDALLRTETSTPDERKALARLAVYAPRCIEAGKSVNFVAFAPFLRAELAETAYKASVTG